MTAAARRLIVYYAILAVVTVVVVVVVFAAGSDEKTQPAIAGGYDVAQPAARCTGLQMDVTQSGEFVGLRRPDGTVLSKARLRDGRLKGDVTCVGGGERALVATVAVKGVLAGTLGGAPLRAELKRDPPPPGALRPRPPPSIAGKYKLAPRSDCLGGAFELEKVGASAYEIKGGIGRLLYTGAGPIAGRVTCRDKSVRAVTGQAVNRDLTLNVPAGGTATTPEKVVASKQRDFTELIAAFFLAVVVVMLFARLMGAAVAHFRQPRVMGEVLAGILLGPTVFGLLFPDLQRALFPSDVIPLIGVVANLGLIFYMFLVGLELDLSQLRGRIAQTAAISNTGVAIPMLAGIAVALPTYTLVGPPAKGGFTAFALFMGVSMSITAFPVLARILVERRMLRRPVGALALASAAIDDVSAWFLIALATAVATSGGGFDVVRTILLAGAFCLVMGVGVRPLIGRVSRAYDEAGRVPVTWITAIFAMVLLAAFTTEEIGIALIFGGFIAGTVMPRHAGLTEDVTHRMEDFVVLLLLPLFFAYTGLKTNVLLLDRAELVVLTLVLLVVAVTCKFGGSVLASRVVGLGWRESAVIGALMNTRGLTELIVLNLALEKGVISEALFAALVLMALVTTFMAGPVLNRLDPKNEFGEPVEAELDRAREETAAITPMPIPDQSILVAPQTEAAMAQLLAVAVPLATSEPPRELIIARLIEPPRGASVRGGLQTERFQLAEAADEVDRVRADLLARSVPARAVAFTSTDVGATWPSWPSARTSISSSSTAGARSAATASRVERSARSCAGRPATSRSSSRARTRSSRWAPSRRWSCPSAAPSTTGPPSSSARGWPRPPARRCACSARPARAKARTMPAACWRPPRCSCSASWASPPSRCWPSRAARVSWRRRRGPACWSSGSQIAGARRAWGPSAMRSPARRRRRSSSCAAACAPARWRRGPT